MNEVKVSTGHNKPENKGRKYFTCASCQTFQWVDNDGEVTHTSGLKVDYAKTPDRKQPIDKPEDKVDWDAKDRQSMAQTAMKSASEIIAAMLNAGILTVESEPALEVKTMANQFFKEIISMKNLESTE